MTGCVLRCAVIDNSHIFSRFEEEWRAFQRDVPPATPFQTPDWLLTWWRHFGNGKLRVFVFRAGSRITGIVPCFLHDWNGRRQLTLIGTGLSDYLDPPVHPAYSDYVVDALHSELAAFQDWDLCDWQDLSDSTPLQKLGASQEDTPCCDLPIGFSFDTFLQSRPRYLRRNLRRCMEIGATLGDVQFTVSETADPDLVTALIDLHGARWGAHGETGMIAANHAAAFLRDAAAALARRDLLLIFSLRLDRQVIAVILALRNRTTVFDYLTAFHPEYRKYGFGHELQFRALQYVHQQGCRWSFLRGDESYKFDWGARKIPKRRVIIER